MSASGHPNDVPGVPMIVPPRLEDFQIKYVNPVVRPIARFVPGFSVIKHRGRASGTPYETVVTAFRKGDVLAIALIHGKTNWVKNVLAAGEADVHFIRSSVHLVNPRVLPAGSSGDGLPSLAKRQLRRVGVFVADIA